MSQIGDIMDWEVNSTPYDRGANAARGAMIHLGRPLAVEWFVKNCPQSAVACTPVMPPEWWLGFRNELDDVQGTA